MKIVYYILRRIIVKKKKANKDIAFQYARFESAPKVNVLNSLGSYNDEEIFPFDEIVFPCCDEL